MQNAAKLTTPEALVANVLQLISLPEIYLRLQQTIDDPLHTREDVAEIIAWDPALSARVLRIANSSYYGFAREFESVADAVGIIGEIELRNLVLATSVVSSMSSLKYPGIDLDSFWLHSLRCGVGARLLAQSVRGCNAETLFLAGILHDLGILVICQHDAALADAIEHQIVEQHQLRDQAERELLGFDHAEVGALLIEAWRLPADLGAMVRWHHQYQMAREQARETQILALANLLAEDAEAASPADDIRTSGLRDALELSEQSLQEIDASAREQCAEIRKIILG